MVAPSVNLVTQEWFRALARYEHPKLLKAIWQLVDTFVPYTALWVLMIYMLRHGVSYWLLLPLIVLAAGFLVRIFIVFHDCGHSSFFASRQANRIVGYLCGILTFTPFDAWRLSHAGHHATVGDLDRRGRGDIWTLTIEEYLAASRRKQIAYRFYRNPFFLFILGSPIIFLVAQRFPGKGMTTQERTSVLLTDLAILAILGAASLTIGLRTYLLIQIPIISIAGTAGIWLFYVQHQFEGVYWARHEEWDPIRAALEGSSYYKLPKALQWFSGNIGLHHIHHLRPRIPNYSLQQCYDEIPEVETVPPLTFWRSLNSLFLHLWDEKNRRMVNFRALKAYSGPDCAG